uniref:8.9 kDa family member n=1 Tax=Rhipicephalus zambeziensis TaxID=60191 RepID=A0A224Y765_9ACAR
MSVMHVLLYIMYAYFILSLNVLFTGIAQGDVFQKRVRVVNGNVCATKKHSFKEGEYWYPPNKCVVGLCVARNNKIAYWNCTKPPKGVGCTVKRNRTARYPKCCPMTVCQRNQR